MGFDLNSIIPILVILGFIVLILYITNRALGWWGYAEHGIEWFYGWLRRGAR